MDSIKNGLQGAVQNYIINGQAYHYSELLAQSYDQAIDFQITEPDLGPLYASRFDDTLKGSDRADVIYGQGGDDLLAGGAGNDRLIGGDGQDTYVLGIGSGADTVIENGTDINTISLHQGLAISDLATEKRGNDLFLHLRGTEDGMILKDYYSALPEWKIQTADGTMSALANLNLPESTLLAASLPEIMDNYMTRVEAFYGGALKVNGFVRKPDGLYHKTITTESFYSTTKTTDHYQLGIEVDSQTVNGNLTADRYNITNKNFNKSRTLSASSTETQTRTRSVNGLFLKRYVDLASVIKNGGVQFSGDETVVPVYGNNPTINSLTGAVEAEITGYNIYTSAIQYETRTATITHRIYENNQQLKIRDMTGSNTPDHLRGRSKFCVNKPALC